MMLDLEKLWEPYSGHGCTLEQHVNWVLATCKKKKIDDQIAQAAIQLVFLEMANGRTFAQGACPCGCEGWNIHTGPNHYTVQLAQELDRERRVETARVLGGNLNAALLKHIEADNAAYLADNMPKPDDRPKGKLRNALDKMWSPYR
jgi:hypothetical protein